jgi:hypothetical protein
VSPYMRKWSRRMPYSAWRYRILMFGDVDFGFFYYDELQRNPFR